MSNNLGRNEVATNQNSKTVTINESDGILDAAITEFIEVDLTAGDFDFNAETQTVQNSFVQSLVVFLNDTDSGIDNRTLTVLTGKKLFIVINQTGSRNVFVTIGSTQIQVAPDARAVLYSNGTVNGLFAITNGV